MKITLTKGTGTGNTLLSAYDNALQECGVSNYNIIPLSSIIPPGSTIIKEKYITPEEDYGKRLYVVWARIESDKKGEFIGGGIGWYQLPDGRGIFVEHHENGTTKDEVEKKLKNDIMTSLNDLCKFRQYNFKAEDLNIELEVSQVNDLPTGVLVMAIYQEDPWR